MMTTTVRIVCEDVSHEGRTVKVATFHRNEAGGWHEAHPRRREDDGSHVSADLHNGVPLFGPQAGSGELRPEEGTRQRHSLRCPLCDESVPVRHEKLAPVLDRLADVGMDRITLPGLRAIVS